jgi:predicted alpha/beta hydrolase
LTPSKPDDEYANGTYGQSLGHLDAVSVPTTVTLRDDPDVALAAADLFADVRTHAIDEQA